MITMRSYLPSNKYLGHMMQVYQLLPLMELLFDMKYAYLFCLIWIKIILAQQKEFHSIVSEKMWSNFISFSFLNISKFKINLFFATRSQCRQDKLELFWVWAISLVPITEFLENVLFPKIMSFIFLYVFKYFWQCMVRPWRAYFNATCASHQATAQVSRLITKPTKWHVHPVKTQIRLGIRPVWSEPSLCPQWVANGPSFHHADSKDSDQNGQMPRLIWVFAGRTYHFVGFVMRRLNLCFY